MASSDRCRGLRIPHHGGHSRIVVLGERRADTRGGSGKRDGNRLAGAATCAGVPQAPLALRLGSSVLQRDPLAERGARPRSVAAHGGRSTTGAAARPGRLPVVRLPGATATQGPAVRDSRGARDAPSLSSVGGGRSKPEESSETAPPPAASDSSTASIERTTSTPMSIDERGLVPSSTAAQKSATSSASGSLASMRGDRMSPVRYESWNSPKLSKSRSDAPESKILTGSGLVSS